MKGKKINLEKALFPKSNKLRKYKDYCKAQIVDAELDPLDCFFHNDDCVIIDTKNTEWITLTEENLNLLLQFIEDARDKFEFEEMWQNVQNKKIKK